MSLTSEPLVSVVTPLYNSEKFLCECIESVLTQRYENWEYVILNNCSKDGSLRIAQSYADQDARIRIVENEEFLLMVENWNHSLELISSDSKYCKIVHADDILFPECISKMVGLAEKEPTVGIVGSYVLEGTRVKCDGLSYHNSVILGHEICRPTLNREMYVFGSPTSLLIRSSLIRNRNPFYNDRYFQVVDQEVCYYLLQNTDFGFLHEVLTFSRLHDKSVTSSNTPLNRLILEELMLLAEYGPIYLSKDEFQQCLSRRMDKYYKFLAGSIFTKKSKDFWKFHREGLKSLDFQLSKRKLANATLREMVRRLLVMSAHPVRTFQMTLKAFKGFG